MGVYLFKRLLLPNWNSSLCSVCAGKEIAGKLQLWIPMKNVAYYEQLFAWIV